MPVEHSLGPMLSPPMRLQPLEAIFSAGVLYGEQYFVAAPPGEPGVKLFARHWRLRADRCRAQVFVVHGYMEHSGRYRELAHSLAQHDISTVAVDLRGHGRSDGPRGYVHRFENYISDLRGSLRGLGEAPTFILAHSLGGLIGLDLLAGHAPLIAGLIVTNPYLKDAHAPPGYKLWIGRHAGRLMPRLNLPAGLSRDGLSHDVALLSQHARDPLIFSHANAAWFRETRLAQIRVRALQSLKTPLLYVYSDADPIADPQANAQLAAQIQAPDKQVLLRAGELHEVLNETRRANLYELIAQWVLARS